MREIYGQKGCAQRRALSARESIEGEVALLVLLATTAPTGVVPPRTHLSDKGLLVMVVMMMVVIAVGTMNVSIFMGMVMVMIAIGSVHVVITVVVIGCHVGTLTEQAPPDFSARRISRKP